MTPKTLAPLCAILLAASAASHGATMIFDTALPTSDVILSNTQKSGSSAIQVYNLAANNVRWVGFGFQAPSAALLDKVTFTIYGHIVTPGALTSPMTISILPLSSLTAVPDSPFNPLYSETATVPATYSSEDYFTIDLATPFQLAANENYGVMLTLGGTPGNNGINLWQSSINTAGTNGRGVTFYTTDSGASYLSSTATLTFTLQSVPEPSPFLLSCGGILVALAFGWRKLACAA